MLIAHNRFYAASFLAITLVTSSAFAGECATIVEPRDGSKVQDTALVEGTAELPPGHHLWILLGIAGTKDWWPQGGGEAELLGSSWEVFVRFGREGQDWNTKFRIAAVVVSPSVHTQLERWVTSSAASRSWDPITFPNTAESCDIARIRVHKKR